MKQGFVVNFTRVVLQGQVAGCPMVVISSTITLYKPPNAVKTFNIM